MTLLQMLLCLFLPVASARGMLDGVNLISRASSSAPAKLIVDQDGNTDDFMAVMVALSQQQQFDVVGVLVIGANSFPELATNTTLKILHHLGRSQVPVGLSTLPGVNPFPDVYKAEGLSVDVLPALNSKGVAVNELRSKHLAKQPGQEWLAQLLLKQPAPVTLLVTGPLSNVAYVLKNQPAAAAKIQSIWWMGGALRAPGNVYNQNKSDGTAEWNVFFDPGAAGVVWASSIPVTLVPLDITNKVPVTPELVISLGGQNDLKYSALAGNMWANVVGWRYTAPTDPYFAWDTVAAACMSQPSLCKIESGIKTQVVLGGRSQGAIRIVTQAGSAAGSAAASPHSKTELSAVKAVSAAVDIDPNQFQAFLLKAFRQ